MQEHIVEAGAASEFKSAAKLAKRHCFLGPVDPENTRKSGGAGFLAKEGTQLIPTQPVNADYADAVNTGRAMIMHFETSEGICYIANVDGWVGGTKGSIAAGRTNDLATIILNDLRAQGTGVWHVHTMRRPQW